MRTCKSLVQAATNGAIDRKNDILQEIGWARSRSCFKVIALVKHNACSRLSWCRSCSKKSWNAEDERILNHICFRYEREEKKRQENELQCSTGEEEMQGRSTFGTPSRRERISHHCRSWKSHWWRTWIWTRQTSVAFTSRRTQQLCPKFVNSQLQDGKPLCNVKLEDSLQLTNCGHVCDSPEEKVKQNL